MFDDPVAHCRGQQIDNRRVNFRWRGKRPAFLSIERNNFYNLIGELFMNAAIGFGCKLRPLPDGVCMAANRAIAHRKAPGQIAHFIDQFPVRIGDIECLH